MRRMFFTLIAVATAGILTSCSSSSKGAASSSESAAQATVRILNLENDGKYGPAWDELHPAQQALVGRDHFIDCTSRFAIDFDKVEVVDTAAERLGLPGTDLQVDSTAVTVKFTAGGQNDTATFHVSQVDGAWRWGLTDPADYTNGACPG